MKYSLPIALSLLTLSQSSARTPLSLQDKTEQIHTYYKEAEFLDNIQNGSSNPSYIINLPSEGLNDITISYNQHKGSFKPIDGAARDNAVNADIYGIKKLERTAFKGSIKYQINNQDDMRWNATVLTTPANPFILADTLRYDSLTNDANRESFILNGAVAYRLSKGITVGLSANYSVASKADQSDPRMESNAARTTVHPGLDFVLGRKYSIGISGLMEVYHEDIESSVQDNMISEHNNVYIFKSLGTHDGKDGLGYIRRYDGKKYGVSLQSSLKTGSICDFTYVSFVKNSENALDGGKSYQFKGGDFSQTIIEAGNRLSIPTGSLLHNLTVRARILNSSGMWYNQKQIKDKWGSKCYQIISKEVVYKQNDMLLDLSYRLDCMRNGLPSFTTVLDAGFSSVSIKQYPDENHADFSKLNTSIKLLKRFWIGNETLELSAQGSYTKAISPLDMEIVTPKPADVRVCNNYFRPKYEYIAANSLGADLCITAYTPSVIDNCTLKCSACASISKYMGEYAKYMNTDRNNISFSLGIIF